MKRVLFLLLYLVSAQSLYAQFFDNNFIYSSGEIYGGNYLGGEIALNWVYKEKHAFKFGWVANAKTPENRPEDYKIGLIDALMLGTTKPYDLMETYQVGYGRIVPINPLGTIRANLSIGLAYSKLKKPTNWEKVQDNFLAQNYTWEYERENHMSIVVSPKIEFPFSRYFGFTVGPILVMNKQETFVGIGAGTIMGLLRREKKQS
ncbi:hypothetical protein [Echinicola sp. 20G]|uniref:hypothetical protein n=1 Tax=Echinicola sp. 20G TaxID=2781961 RepID=UPI001910F116|nr:hypothetical protein [Echinicola sp. 20G]